MIIGAINIIEVGPRLVGIKCSKGRGVIFPGGKWECGETFSECATRELKEETGLDATHQHLVFSGMSPDMAYVYAFHTDIIGFGCLEVEKGTGLSVFTFNGKPRNLGSGEVVLAPWSEFLKSDFGPYYDLLKKEFSL